MKLSTGHKIINLTSHASEEAEGGQGYDQGQEQYKEHTGHLQIMQELNNNWKAPAISDYVIKTHCFTSKHGVEVNGV